MEDPVLSFLRLESGIGDAHHGCLFQQWPLPARGLVQLFLHAANPHATTWYPTFSLIFMVGGPSESVS